MALPEIDASTGALIVASVIIAFVARWFFTKLFTDYLSKPVDRFVNWLLRRKPARDSLDGLWYSVYWRYNRGNDLRSYAHVLLIKSRADSFTAKTILGPPRRCVLEGRVDSKGFISGTWRNEDNRTQYHGAFQFSRHPGEDVIGGKWLGWNRDGRINSGVWVFCRATDDVSAKGQKALRQRLGLADDPFKSIHDPEFESKIARVVATEKNSDIDLSFRDLSEKMSRTSMPKQAQG